MLEPGPMLSNPINTLSMSIGLIFGLAGLPHILMRFLRFQMLLKHAVQSFMLLVILVTSLL